MKALAGYGLPQKQIAIIVEVGSVDRLRKYFHEELRLGPLEAQSNVSSTLFRLASSGRNPTATMFWMKTRARWSEQGKVEEREAPSHIVWEIREHQPPRSPENQKLLEESLRRFGDNPAEPVHWEGDKGYQEDEEGEAPRRRRRYYVNAPSSWFGWASRMPIELCSRPLAFHSPESVHGRREPCSPGGEKQL